MNALQLYLIGKIRTDYALAETSTGKFSLLGDVAGVLGASSEEVLKAQGEAGWPCPMLRAYARCLQSL